MTGTRYDITQFIDLQKMQAEFDKLDARVQQSAKEMDKLIGKMGALGVGTDYSKAAAKIEEYRAKMELAEKNYQDSMSKIVEQANAKAQLAEQKHQEKLAQIQAANQAKLEQLKEQHANTMARIGQLQADKLAAQQQAQSAREAQQQQAAIDKRIAKEQAAIDKIEQARRRADAKAAFSYTPEQKASVSYDSGKQAQTLKLNAILASEYSTALEKLDAKMRLLEIDMQSKFNPALQEQSSEFRQLVAQHKTVQEEYNRTARATQVMSRANSSANNSIFQFTQVLRELPNFAISARVGFMSLSNNLPQLVDGFKRLRQEIIDTEGAAGATRKTIAAFAKSLLSIETIVLIVATALVMYGDDLWEATKKALNMESATKKLSSAQLGLYDSMKLLRGAVASGLNEYSSVITSIDKMSASLANAKGNHKEEKYYLDEYNKSLGETFGKATSVDQALKLIAQNKDPYIEAMKQMAFANVFFSKSAEDAVKILETGLKSKAQIVKDSGNDAKAMYSDLSALDKAIEEAKKKGTASLNLKGKGGLFGGSSVTDATVEELASMRKFLQDKIDKIAETERSRQYKLIGDHQKATENQAKKHLKNMSDLYDKYGWGFPSDDKSGTKALKKLTEIHNTQEFYDHQRAVTLAELAALEDRITKSTLTGTLNSYTERGLAAERYYSISRRLAEIDAETARKAANEKLQTELRNNAIKYNDNVRKFGGSSAKTISLKGDVASNSAAAISSNTGKSAKLDTSGEQLKTGNAVLERNNALAIQKINDELNQKLIEQDKRFMKDKFQIEQDIYAEKVYMLEQAQSDQEKYLDRQTTLEKTRITKKSTGSIIGEAVSGKSKDTAQEQADAEYYNSQKKHLSKLITLRMEMQGASGEQQLALKKKIDETEKVMDEEKLNYEIAKQKEAQEKMQELQLDLTKSLISNITDLWSTFFDILNDKIDENLEKQTKVNEERVKQYEDETETGKHTSQELSDYKDRMAAYQQSQEEEAAAKKAENERNAFLLSQAMAVGNIWIQYAIAQQAIMASGASLGPILGIPYTAFMSGLNLTTAITGTALAAAQTIPYFKDGTDNSPEGLAIVGDGGKKELIVMPSGKWFVSPDKPTPAYLEAGSKVYPDINRIDMQGFMALASTRGNLDRGINMAVVESELRELNQNVRSQRPAQFHGMPLINQLSRSERFSRRKRGLMN